MCVQYEGVCGVSVFMFGEGVCGKCLLYVLNHFCTKVRALCVFWGSQQSGGGTSAHSGTGLLPLHTAPAEQRFTA